MLGKFLEQHRQTAVLIISGFILLGSGISFGIGFSQPFHPESDVKFSGETLSPGEELPAPTVGVDFPLNINTSTALELDELPGIGSSKAAAIVDYRNKNGLFQKKADLQNVSGIGPATYAKLESLIRVK